MIVFLEEYLQIKEALGSMETEESCKVAQKIRKGELRKKIFSISHTYKYDLYEQFAIFFHPSQLVPDFVCVLSNSAITFSFIDFKERLSSLFFD